MADKNGNYDNLIDAYLEIEADPAFSGKITDQFMKLLSGYFFEKEKSASRNMELVINNLALPRFISEARTIFDIDREELRKYVTGGSINDSLAGRIMLSQHYLKAFYPHHAPSFGKLPEDVRFELMDLIKEKNEAILSAFEKMLVDRTADKQRKILTLVALILKNVHLKTGAPFNKLPKPANEILRSIFHNTDDVFAATQKQIADLLDDSKIKQLIKIFFTVKQFKEITEIAMLFKEELERYRKRTASARG
ncbi:MAG: hypothetical protein A2W19_15520 [Spirochaetes bacterium RBG_16_49_21]|nr:MAG: hypothetical protein A2W19_15520 [Spirochaetes bacterium RBG_16_49_21]